MQKLTVTKQISNHIDRIDRERRTGDDQVAVDVLPEKRRRANRAPTGKQPRERRSPAHEVRETQQADVPDLPVQPPHQRPGNEKARQDGDRFEPHSPAPCVTTDDEGQTGKMRPAQMNTQLWSQTGSVAIAAPSVAGIAGSTRPYGSRGAPRH